MHAFAPTHLKITIVMECICICVLYNHLNFSMPFCMVTALLSLSSLFRYFSRNASRCCNTVIDIPTTFNIILFYITFIEWLCILYIYSNNFSLFSKIGLSYTRVLIEVGRPEVTELVKT